MFKSRSPEAVPPPDPKKSMYVEYKDTATIESSRVTLSDLRELVDATKGWPGSAEVQTYRDDHVPGGGLWVNPKQYINVITKNKES